MQVPAIGFRFENVHAPYDILPEQTQSQLRATIDTAFPGSGTNSNFTGALAFLRIAVVKQEDTQTLDLSPAGTVIGVGIVRRYLSEKYDMLEPFVIEPNFRNKFSVPKKPKPHHGSMLLAYIFETLQLREAPWGQQKHLQILPVEGKQNFFHNSLPLSTYYEESHTLIAPYD